MSQQKLLKKLVFALDDINVDYMLSGSIASSLQGEPRSTHDIDVVVELKKTDAHKLLEAFPFSDFYYDENHINKMIEEKGMFNIIDIKEGDKIDFWMISNTPFDESRFRRKIKEKFSGFEIKVSSPEDTILAKLRWAKLSGGSEKQLKDALRVYEIQWREMNHEYLEKWSKILEIESLFNELKQKSIPIK